MKISIRNYRRVERADIEGGPIVLVGGKNDNGKSSVLQAVAIAVTGWALPPGRLKKDAARLIRRGADKGSVAATIGDGAVLLSFPKAEAVFDGEIKISTIAAGLTPLSAMKPDDMATALGRFIGADPSLDDIIEACRDAGLGADLAGKIWKKVEASGWKEAEQQGRDQGIKLKTIWEQRTGQKRWGATIGAEWRPPNWQPEFADLVIEEAAIIELRQRLQRAREMAAVDSSVMERLEREAGGLDAAETAVAAAKERLALDEAAVERATSALAALPRPEARGAEMPCPHCGGFLTLNKVGDGVHRLEAAATVAVSDEVIKKQRLAIAGAEGDVANARAHLGDAKAAVLNAQVALTRAKAAADELAAAQAKTGGEDVGALAAELADMEMKFTAIENARLAAQGHALIVQNVALQKILAPEGLRRTVMNRSLETFNTGVLAPMCAEAGWPAVRITPDMTIMWGDMDWVDLGESARWIVDRIIQVAIARADGSKLVIMDAADICDAGNRNKLFGLLMKQPFETLVGMTFNKPDLMPDLASAKAGARFWVNNGISEAIAS